MVVAGKSKYYLKTIVKQLKYIFVLQSDCKLKKYSEKKQKQDGLC